MLGYYLRLAVGRLRRTPWLALLMILSLAVGIAAGMTTITLRYVLGLDPIPGKSERLLSFRVRSPSNPLDNEFSYANARALSRLGGPNADAVISGEGIVTSLAVADQREPLGQQVGIRYTMPDFFRVFNVPIVHGRTWTQAEAASAAPVVVVDQATANDWFHGASGIGQRLRVGDTLYTVIGLSGDWNPQPRYYDLDGVAGAFGGGGDALFMPITAVRYAPDNAMVSRTCPSASAVASAPSTLLTSGCAWLSVWYLAHSRQDARALTQTVHVRLPLLLPTRRADKLRLLNVKQILTEADVVPGSVRLYAILGIAFLVLCVVNASGMQLSRVLRSSQQIGVRRALGASHVEIIKQYLCDALLVSGIGGLLGVGLTFAGLYGVRHLQGVYYANMARMDGTMFVLMLALVLVCGALVGAVPAWLASRADPALVIKVPE